MQQKNVHSTKKNHTKKKCYTLREQILDRVQEYFIILVITIFFGIYAYYSANAATKEPTREQWEAYAKLKPVKKFDYDKIYDDITNDIALLSRREEFYKEELPIQLSGPLKNMDKNPYSAKTKKNKQDKE